LRVRLLLTLTLALYFDNIGNMEMKRTTALDALAGLAQPTRLDIFRLLVQHGPDGLPAGEIAERLDLANATASFHLKELTQAELVRPRQAGRFIYYSANYPTMNGLIAYLTENCCQGSTCDIACAPIAKRRKKAS
jgi:ArsR family transcriptional regulator, arsenate/arsenite/antimonite-responsive transcriptional repressor